MDSRPPTLKPGTLTREQAELMTGFRSREYAGARNPWLNCQLGRLRSEARPSPKNGMPLPGSVFDLAGFGETWAAAAARAKTSRF